MTRPKLLSLHDAADHPEARRRGITRNLLRDAMLRGALKRQDDHLVDGRNATRKVYAVTEEALLEYLDTDPDPHPWITRPTQPQMTRAQSRAQTTANQRRAALFRLKRELIGEANSYDMTLDQYLELIDFDEDKRKALAQLGQGLYPSTHNMEEQDDRQDSTPLLGEEDLEEPILCGEESGGDDGDDICLGDFRAVAQ